MGSSNFFQVFDFDFLEGNAASAFDDNAAIVLTESMAKRYFGNQPAVGQFLELKGSSLSLQVTGVISDMPSNTHFRKDGVVNIEGFETILQ